MQARSGFSAKDMLQDINPYYSGMFQAVFYNNFGYIRETSSKNVSNCFPFYLCSFLVPIQAITPGWKLFCIVSNLQKEWRTN